MSGPYVNDDGDVWVERGAVPWRRAWAEAWSVADWSFSSDYDRFVYYGIDRAILVSDEHEQPCESAMTAHYDEKQAPTCGCCRVIDAYHFRAEER